MSPGLTPGRIESTGNRRVKVYRSLASAKGRAEHGRFQLEGTSLIAEALDAGVKLEAAYWCPERVRDEAERRLARALQDRADLLEVSERVLAYMASTVTPQPFAAEAPIPAIGLQDIRADDRGLVVAPVDVQDPGNLGTLVRTAHAVGAPAVVALGHCADLYSPKVVRATMGSLFGLTVVQEPDPQKLIEWCGEQGFEAVAATTRGESRLFEASFPPRTALLLGSESQGLREKLLGPGVRTIAIPMPGGTESLNVAVAAAILMYEYRRQHPLRPQRRGCKGCEGAK